MVANLLRKRLPRAASILVVGQGGDHVFQPASLDVAFRGARPERFIHAQRLLLRRGVSFDPTGAERIDPSRRVVRLLDGRELPFDALVLATGALADPTLLPGLAGHGLDFHTGPHQARRIWDALREFRSGRVVVAIAGVPYKCPPSPVEAVFLLDEYFRTRGDRDAVTITLATPYPRAYPAPAVSDVVEPRLREKGIELVTLFNMGGVDAERKVVHSLEGEEVAYDLLIAIPPHRGADVIVASGLGDADGFVPTDKETMRVVGHERIFALGDATAIPISKSGVVAHLEAPVVAENVARFLEGAPGERAYEGRINCPMEMGEREALFVSATYESPAEHQLPNLVRYMMKRAFTHLYWSSLRGELEWVFRPYFGRTSHEKKQEVE